VIPSFCILYCNDVRFMPSFATRTGDPYRLSSVGTEPLWWMIVVIFGIIAFTLWRAIAIGIASRMARARAPEPVPHHSIVYQDGTAVYHRVFGSKWL
jgi:hypothetical protein